MENIFSRAVENLVNPQMRSASDSLRGLTNLFPPRLTEGAKKVNTNSALTISAFYCAVGTIADSIALLPMSVYRKTGKMKDHEPTHPVDYLLYREPNSYMTAFTFKFIMVVSVLMRGNAYAIIQRNNSGNVAAYQFVDQSDVTVKSNSGKLFYIIKGITYSADEIIHIPGFSFDGICGRSIIEHAADNLGVSLSAQQFGSDALNDRGLSHGIIETDKSVDKTPKEKIANHVSERLQSGNKFRVAMLDEGMKYKTIALTPQEAQFIETYASGIPDIARWFKIPLHKLHVSGEGGYNFLVQMSIEYLQTAVMPIGEKFKQEFERKSFTRAERVSGIYIFQNYNKLLQADPKARSEYYKSLYYIGVYNPNEIRELEDRNPRDDDGGDLYVQPSNMMNELQMKKQVENEAV